MGRKVEMGMLVRPGFCSALIALRDWETLAARVVLPGGIDQTVSCVATGCLDGWLRAYRNLGSR